MAAITVSEISRLVDGFYVKVREDAKIGPIFNASIKDWPRHLTLLKNFWSSVLLTTGTYQGDPIAIHVRLPLEKGHFERWLALFAETATQLLSPQNAALVIGKSEDIARTFELAIAHKRANHCSSASHE